MILFSQGPTRHSRIGNSLVWMRLARPFLTAIGRPGVFPWAVEQFGNYLEPSNPWLQLPPAVAQAFEQRFGCPLTAADISRVSRRIEVSHERAHGVTLRQSDAIVIESAEGGGVLYLCGRVDVTEPRIVDLIARHEWVICHEAYGFQYAADPALAGEDWASIQPSRAYFEQQRRLVLDRSGDRRTVGLHIRRGDYARWRDGVYLYGDDFWVSMAEDLVLQEQSVWIFSNDLSAELASRLEAAGAHLLSDGFEVEFTRMMCMDTVIGPPSTFSGMAVAIGRRLFGSRGLLIRWPALPAPAAPAP